MRSGDKLAPFESSSNERLLKDSGKIGESVR
jgi:hypothetical protein